MKTNYKSTKLSRKFEKDPIFDAVVARMTEKGKGFFIISCGPWIHPLNTVPNCYVIMFDGFIEYKFELTDKGYKAAEIRCTEWLALKLIVGMTYTWEELVELIKAG